MELGFNSSLGRCVSKLIMGAERLWRCSRKRLATFGAAIPVAMSGSSALAQIPDFSTAVLITDPIFLTDDYRPQTSRVMFDTPGEAFAAYQAWLAQQKALNPGYLYTEVWNLRVWNSAYYYNGVPSAWQWDFQQWYPGPPPYPAAPQGTTGTIDTRWFCPEDSKNPEVSWARKSLQTSPGNYKVWCEARITCPEPGKCPWNNPLFVEAGVKYQVELDYRSANGLLENRRVYRSDTNAHVGKRLPRLLDYSRDGATGGCFPGRYKAKDGSGSVLRESGHCFSYRGLGTQAALWMDGSGRYVPFTEQSGQLKGPANVAMRLQKDPATGQWTLVHPNNTIDTYGSEGQLLHRDTADGKRVSYTYSNASTPAEVAPYAGLIIGVTDPFGRSTSYRYDANANIIEFRDPAGQIYGYKYHPAQSCAGPACGRLLTVSYPDQKQRSYHWNEQALTSNTDLPDALTGITDERGIRIGSYGYNSSGKAISTEGAGGVNKLQVTGRPWSTRVILRNALGSESTIDYTNVLSTLYPTAQSQPAGSGCAAATSTQAVDAQGNVVSRNDFNGNRVCYGYDTARSLEIVRVEGLNGGATCSTYTQSGATLPTGSRKVSTQWHPDWRLSTKVAEPGRITTMVYNGQPDPLNGNVTASCAPADALLPGGKPIAVVCRRIEEATTDTNGAAGFGAALATGTPARHWRYTYNRFGQVLTEDGPRNDVSDVTTYEYYEETTADATRGDLKLITNAAGQTTRFTRYDTHGKPLQVTDSNAVVSDYAYDARQRLISVTNPSGTTRYQYDGAGGLERITQPDGSFVEFLYDDAHRLIAIIDNLGNRIDYTLDNAGNRTGEQVKDPAGVLARSLTLGIDALGRVQQTVGRE